VAGSVLRPAEGPLEGKRAILALLGLLALGALVRVGAIFTVGDVSVLQGDEEYYVAHGFALARGEAYGDSMRAPLFPAFVALVARVGGFSLTAVRLAQVPISLLAVVFVFDLVRRRFGTRPALVSGLLVALSPTLVHYTHFLWSETLFTTALLGSLWALDRWDASRRAGWLLAGGAFFGAAVMTREMILSFVVVVLVWLWRATRDVRRIALFLAPMALLILPWTARNYALHGRFVLVSTMRWYPIAVGNQSGGPRAPEAGTSDFTRRYFSMTDELEREAFARATALGAIRDQQPLWVFRKTLRNTRKLFDLGGQLGRFARQGWLPPEKTRLAARLDDVESALYILLMLIGLPALWLVPGGRTKTLIVGVILYFIAIHVVANSVARFRVPLLPLFALYTGPLLRGAAGPGAWSRGRLAGAALSTLLFVAVILAGILGG
jgi:4-amino-4-deoxy-L-arabinose transferase-like glycosyltransferase